MYALPTLVTDSRAFDLPLSGATAQHLVAALLAAEPDDPAQAARLLAETLETDAVFALWATCRAAARDAEMPLTIEQCALWMARALTRELVWTEHDGDLGPRPMKLSDAERKRWADLAGRAYGVARLASLLARCNALDADRAHLLGLLHSAPEALRAASRTMRESGPRRRRAASRHAPKQRQPKPAVYHEVLPPALVCDLDAVEASRETNPSSVVQCVATALRIAAGRRVSRTAQTGLRFDRRAHAAAVRAVRDRWLDTSAVAGVLPTLARKLDKLHKLEDDFRRSLEVEKLDALKELAYGAGHEINNPLANISARAQTLLPDERDPERRRMLAAINTQAFRAHEMIADMMLFARPPRPKLAEVNLVELVGGVVDELAPLAAAQHTQLVYRAPASQLTARVDKTQIAVAVRALCVNSLEALASGGSIELAINRIELDAAGPAKSRASGETLQITVSDNGPGIPPEVRRHIFDPFYSGREAGRGLGFGLSKCWRIVSMHGGRIDVDASPGGGARLAIKLPADSAPQLPPSHDGQHFSLPP